MPILSYGSQTIPSGTGPGNPGVFWLGPVFASGKLWLYGLYISSKRVAAWSINPPASDGNNWVVIDSTPDSGDSGTDFFAPSIYIDPATGKCWAGIATHDQCSNGAGSSGVDDGVHGVTQIWFFNPAVGTWQNVSNGLSTHNIVFESAFDYTNAYSVIAVNCPGPFVVGDALIVRFRQSLVPNFVPALCYKVAGDVVTIIYTASGNVLPGDLPDIDALSNDDGATYFPLTTFSTQPRNYLMLQVAGNNFAIGDKVRILTTTSSELTTCPYTNGWMVVEDVFESQYVSLQLNTAHFNATQDELVPFSTSQSSTGTIARYSDSGPGLYYTSLITQPVTANDCSGASPHRAAGQSSTLTTFVVPRPNGDVVVIYRADAGLSFATLNGSWANSQVIGTVDAGGLNYQIVSANPDSLGGVYVLLATGTPAVDSPQNANFYVIYIRANNTFTAPTQLNISPYVQNDPTNLAAGDFPVSDPCGGTEAPFQTFAVGNILVSGGEVFIPVRWADKTVRLMVEAEGSNSWAGTPEIVPAYFGPDPTIMTGFSAAPISVQHVNGAVYVTYQFYVSVADANSFPIWSWAKRLSAGSYDTGIAFTDIHSGAQGRVAFNAISMGWDPLEDQPIFVPFPQGNANYSFLYGSGILPLSADCDNPPSAKVGVEYLHTLGASGGAGPYTFTVISGSLPRGLVLNASTGVITGIPISLWTTSPTFTVRVTDSLGSSVTITCSIEVTGTVPEVAAGAYTACDPCDTRNMGIWRVHERLTGWEFTR